MIPDDQIKVSSFSILKWVKAVRFQSFINTRRFITLLSIY